MRLRAHIYVFAAVLGLASCDRSGTANETSLVDAQNVASQLDLTNETIIIFRDASGGGVLNYELHPDNQLLVKHLGWQGSQQRLLAEEKFALGEERAEKARRMLGRLRPDNDAPAGRSLPRGCGYVTDVQPEMGVGFSRDNYSRFEQFSLPSEEQCQSPAAGQSRAILLDVLWSFPKSKIDARFPLTP